MDGLFREKHVKIITGEMTLSCITAFYALVQGRVQGVGFRYSAIREANRHGLKGWVRNTDDGDVEVWAEGPEEKLDLFLEWLKRGPEYSRVDRVNAEISTPRGYRDFIVQH